MCYAWHHHYINQRTAKDHCYHRSDTQCTRDPSHRVLPDLPANMLLLLLLLQLPTPSPTPSPPPGG